MREIEIEPKATGRRRPKIATAAEERFRALLGEWERGGDTMGTVAAKHGVSPTTLKWWRSELKRRDRERGHSATAPSTVELLPVRVTSPVPSPVTRATTFEVALCGGQRVLRIPPGFDAADVRALVEAVEGGPC